MKKLLLTLLILVLLSGCDNEESLKCKEAAKIDYMMENPKCMAGFVVTAVSSGECYCYDYICGEKSCEETKGIYFDLK